MAALYLDADIGPTLCRLLLDRSHDVLTAADVDMRLADDADHLAYATESDRVLVTHNGKDYFTLCKGWHAWRRRWGLTHLPHAGVISIPQHPYVPNLQSTDNIERLLASSAPLWNGLWFYDRQVADWVQRI